MAIKWKDTVKGGKVVISDLTLPCKITLSVVSCHIHHRGSWIVRSSVPSLDMQELFENSDSKSVEDAKVAALAIFKDCLNKLTSAVEGV